MYESLRGLTWQEAQPELLISMESDAETAHAPSDAQSLVRRVLASLRITQLRSEVPVRRTTRASN